MITKDKVVGTLISGAIGDAMGAPVELWTPEFMKKKLGTNIINSYIKTHKNDFLGQYTDDTEMSIGTIQSLIESCGFNGDNMLKHYANNYNYNRGYGITTSELLESVKNNNIIRNKENKTSNGALMRIASIGLYYHNYNDSELYYIVEKMCAITNHNSIESIEACYIHCKLIQLFLSKNVDKSEIIKYLNNLLNNIKSDILKNKLNNVLNNINDNEENLAKDINEYYSTNVSTSLVLVILAFINNYENPLKIITQVISYGGDTDTNACVAGYLVGAYYGTKWIREDLINDLENSNLICDLAEKLYDQIKLNEDIRNSLDKPFSDKRYI